MGKEDPRLILQNAEGLKKRVEMYSAKAEEVFKPSRERLVRDSLTFFFDHKLSFQHLNPLFEEGASIKFNRQGKNEAKSIYERSRLVYTPSELKDGASNAGIYFRTKAVELKKEIKRKAKKEWESKGLKTRANPDFKAYAKARLESDEELKKNKMVRKFLRNIAQKARAELQREERDKVKSEIDVSELDALRQELTANGKKVPSEALLKNIIAARKMSPKNVSTSLQGSETEADPHKTDQPSDEKISEIPNPKDGVNREWSNVKTAKIHNIFGRFTRQFQNNAPEDLRNNGESNKKLIEKISKSNAARIAGIVLIGTAAILARTHLGGREPNFNAGGGLSNKGNEQPADDPYKNKLEGIVFEDSNLSTQRNREEEKSRLSFDPNLEIQNNRSSEKTTPAPYPVASLSTETTAQSSHSSFRSSQLEPEFQKISPDDLMRYLKTNKEFKSEAEKREFVEAVIKMAKDLDPDNTNPQLARDLMDGMFFMSKISPSYDKNGRAGIAAFTGNTALSLGITNEQLKKKSPIEQLSYLKEYLTPYTLRNLSDLMNALQQAAA